MLTPLATSVSLARPLRASASVGGLAWTSARGGSFVVVYSARRERLPDRRYVAPSSLSPCHPALVSRWASTTSALSLLVIGDNEARPQYLR